MTLLDKMLGRNSSHVSHKLKGQKRLPGESFKRYRERLRREADLLKSYLRGDMVWCAKAFKSKQFGTSETGEPVTIMVPDQQVSKGTYIKKKHGIITSPRRTI